MKKVLILSYYYPPANFIAGRRAYGVSKYLHEFGWTPYVVTIDWNLGNINMMGIDNSKGKASHIKHEVIRLPYRANLTYPFAERLLRRGRTFLYPPKSFYDYYTGAMALCSTFLESMEVNAIWATYPGATTHLIAHEMRRKYNVPWIGDIRDLWDEKYSGYAYLLMRLRFIMPKLLKNCSEVTTVSGGLADKLRRITDKPINCVYNGYDPDDYLGRNTVCSRKDKFTIVYTGTFINEMSPKSFFKAIRQLLDRRQIDESRVRIVFYGSGHEKLAALLKETETEHISTVHGPISHSDVPEIQMNATVLLHMSHPSMKGIMTGKIFEYLAARRPILSVPGDKDCVEGVLQTTRAGCCCASVSSIAGQIKVWYREWKDTGQVSYLGLDDVISQYSYRETARQTAIVLDRIAQ